MAHAKLIATGFAGAVIAALCCATPILVVLLSAVGLSAITGYLDYLLIPAMLVFIVIGVYGLMRS